MSSTDLGDLAKLGRRDRRHLTQFDWCVLTVVGDDGWAVTYPVTIEAVSPVIVAARIAGEGFPQGQRHACLTAHRHNDHYESLSQAVLLGEVVATGVEARFRPRVIMRSTRPGGILGEIKTGVESTFKGRRRLRKWGRDPLPIEVIERAFKVRSGAKDAGA